MKRWIASVLAAAMLLPCIPTAGAVDAQSKEPPATGTSAYRPESLKDSGPEVVQSEEEISPDEEVTAIIVLEKKISPLARFQQKSIQNEISKNVLDGEKLEVLHSYTTVENGFAAVVPYGKLEEIRQLPGVAAAYAAPVFKVAPDMPTTMTELGGLENTSGYQGEGMVIAIVDSGLEISHPLFRQAPTTPALMKKDIETVLARKNLKAEEKKSGITASQVYKTAKVPFAFDYADNDLDVAPNGAGDHGTHVAGIAAANAGVVADVVGVAPQAQILAMKVFSSSGSNGATWDDILAAADDAVALGADVINMSLGSTCGFSTPEGEEGVAEVLNNIAESGVMLSISAGNEYSAALGTRIGKGHALTQNPDYGTVASPSSYSEPLSIASVEKADSIDSCYLTVGERKVAFNDTVEDKTVENVKDDSPSFRSLAGKELEYVVVPNAGEVKDYDGLSVEGKIALVSRGSVEYNAKKNAAKEAGAIGILVYNNEPGMLYMQLDNYDLPSAFISQADGKALAAVAEGNRKLTVSASYGKVDNPTSGEMSDFSSWGVTPELTLKPDLTAPGGNIKSATTGGGYTTKSGTSMSAPFVSGAMALVKQYVEQKNYASTETKKANLVSNLLMSTADLVMAGAAPYSPRKQGAGSVNIAAATSTKAYLTAVGGGRPKVELGDDAQKTGKYEVKFEVHNLTNEELTYTVGGYIQTDAQEVTKQIEGEDVHQVTELPYLLGKIDAKTVTVAGGETETVSVSVSLTQANNEYLNRFENGTYIEGFVTLTPSSGTQPTLSIPYMGFYGDWTQAPIIDATDYGNMLNGEAEWSQAYVNTAASNSLEGTVNTYLGDNPYHSGESYLAARNAISPNGDDYMDTLSFVYTGLLRNVKALNYEIKDAKTGDVYYSNKVDYETKSVYSSNYYQIVPSGASDYNKLSWGGTKKDGYSKLKNNDKVIVTVSGELSYDKHVANNQKSSWSFPITIDTEEPEAKDITVSNENGKYYVSLKVTDNQFVSNVTISNNAESKELASFPVAETTAGATTECKYDITGFGENLKVVVNDYACNRKVYSIKAEGNTDASEIIVPTKTVLTEDFEGNSFPSDGWTLKSQAAKTWYQGTEYGSKMAIVDGSKTEQQKEWLISPAIDLSKQATKAGIVFDFYTNYYWSVTNHHHNLKVMASTDNGENWEQIWQLWDWNQKNEFGPWEKTQAKVTIPDKFQDAKSVKFAFVYEGKDSTSLWLDNVNVYVEDPSQIHTITATAGEGGSIDPSGSVQISDGKSRTFTITPDEGYFLSDVKVDDASIGPKTSYTFTNVKEDHSITAEFTSRTGGDKTVLLEEDFQNCTAGGAFPDGWTVESSNSNSTWAVYKYYYADNTLTASCTEDYSGKAKQDERLITPVLDMSNGGGAVSFRYIGGKYPTIDGDYTVKLEASKDGSTWTTIWTSTELKGTVYDEIGYSGNTLSANVAVNIPAELQSSTTKLAFRYERPAGDKSGRGAVDNIRIMANQASSGGGESTLLDENFDDCITSGYSGNIPATWTQTKKNSGIYTWRTYKTNGHITAYCTNDSSSVSDSYGGGDEWGAGQDEYLITPALDLSGKTASMTFQFSSNNVKQIQETLSRDGTTFTLEASKDGTTWTPIWNAASIVKQLTETVVSSAYKTANTTVEIPAEFQTSGVKFAFRYQTKNGNTGGCTVLIDDVKLTASGGSSETPTQPTTFTITASAGQGGSITPSGAVSVAKGGSQTFTIKPSDNYEIEDVKVDNQSVGKKTEYTFENVTKAHTIAATFTEKAVILPDSIHEDFNNSEALPAGWTVDGPSSKYYNTWKIDRYTALNSSNAAICTQNIMFKQEQKEKLILPQIKMKSGMALTFDFGGSYEELSSGSIKFTVKATKDKGQTWTEIWNAKEHLPSVDEDSSVEDITGKGNVAIPSTFCVDGAQFAFVFESSDRRNGSVAVDNVVLDTSSTPAPERYGITIATVQNGTVTADKATATEGETVTLTVKPDVGYHLKSLMAGDKTLTSAPYTFTMPAREVTVSALFEKDAEQPTTGSYKDGTYTGSAKGHDSTVPVTVTVTVENGNISRIDVTKQNETKGYWEKAIAIIEKLLGLGNDSAVDDVTTISGATQSSTAIKEAVQNALKNAEEADGSESNPYVITNIDQLKDFADAVNKGNSYAGKYVVLGANLDLAEIAIWAPIGNSDHGKTNAFAGTFDGKGYTVSHVNCGKAGAAASYEAIGFFGVVSGTVKNLNVQIDKFYNTYSEYNIAMGGLVGILESKAVIDHCSVTGPDFALSDEGTAAKVVGGLVGHMKSNSLVANSWSDIYISAGSLALNTQISVGGICGQQAKNSLIANSASFGSVVSTVMTGKLRVGGLVGQTSGAIYNCYTSSTTKATLMGTDFKADDAAATTAIGHLIGSSTAGVALYDCYYDKNADQFSNSDMAGDPSEGKTERRQATGWENGSNVKTDESFIEAKTASELASDAFAMVLNGNTKNNIKNAASDYFKGKNLLTDAVSTWEDKADDGFLSWKLTGDRVLFGDTAVVTVDVASVALLEQRSVAYGTAKNALKLPETVEVTLSNNKKVNLSVHWTCDKYDGNTAGDYTFEGTLLLTDGITNPKSLKAYVVVKVQPKQDGGNTGGGGSGGGGGGSSGGGSSSGGSGNTGNNGSSSTSFLDIRTHWAKSAIESAVAKGLFAGTSPTTFHPDQTMNRAMLVTVLYRMEKEPTAEGDGKRFADVPAGAYYAKAVAWASAKGIVAGYSDTQFGPEDTITREQLAVILNRYTTYKGYNTSKSADLAAFQDADQISEWARVPVQWANAMKLLNGRTSTTLAPKGSATRAEVAKILVTFLDTVKR